MIKVVYGIHMGKTVEVKRVHFMMFELMLLTSGEVLSLQAAAAPRASPVGVQGFCPATLFWRSQNGGCRL